MKTLSQNISNSSRSRSRSNKSLLTKVFNKLNINE